MSLAHATCAALLAALATCALPPAATPAEPAAFAEARQRMVDREIVAAGVKDPRVVESMRKTPRHEFVPPAERSRAYLDMALPIGEAQTISPPFVVAYMTEQLDPQPSDKVLEIGTGSGYQAAVLSPLVKEVYSIEIVKSLGETAARTLKRLGYKNVFTRVGDGYQGWPERGPFDKIIVTCSPEKVPTRLVEQLRDGGRMVVPVGQRYQQTLYLFRKQGDRLVSEALRPTLFVPMTGLAETERRIRPNPTQPAIANGSFEEISPGKDGAAAAEPLLGWHYQRQLKLVENAAAPDGKRYVVFTNSDAGRGSQALQGLAIDGRAVREIELSAQVKADNVHQGPTKDSLPVVGIQFYDENRAHAGASWLGPWEGTFDWREEVETVRVPLRAREAVLHIGLGGATGELSLDDLRLRVKKRG
jgi:protein-L-isoaspartate(D-aspartate) O-methyltransferase